MEGHGHSGQEPAQIALIGKRLSKVVMHTESMSSNLFLFAVHGARNLQNKKKGTCLSVPCMLFVFLAQIFNTHQQSITTFSTEMTLIHLIDYE